MKQFNNEIIKRNERNNSIVSLLNYFIILLLLLTTFHSQAQTIIKSISEKVPTRFNDYEIIGKNNIGTIVHYYGNNENELAVYDDKMRVVNRRDLPFTGKGVSIESFVLLPSKVLIFYTTNGESYQYLKIKVLDQNLIVPNEVYVLDSIPIINIGKGKSFYVKVAPDKSSFLVFNILQAKSTYYIKFQVLSASLQITAKNVFSLLDINPSDLALKSMKINNEGNVVGVVGHKNNSSSDYEFNKFTIFTFNKSSKTNGELVFSNSNYQYKNIITEVSTKRDVIYISACYQNPTSRNDLGIETKIFDFRTNNEIFNSKIPFNEDVLMKSQNYDFKAWQDKATLIKPKRIIPRSDGGYILITEGEYKFTKVERVNDNINNFNTMPIAAPIRYTDQYHFYDINIFSVNNKSELEWKKDMPKYQISENDDGYFSSFSIFEANNVLKCFYYEETTNPGNFIEYNINPNGILKRVSVLNSENQGYELVPSKSKQLDGNTILFPSEQKRNLQFVLFQY